MYKDGWFPYNGVHKLYELKSKGVKYQSSKIALAMNDKLPSLMVVITSILSSLISNLLHPLICARFRPNLQDRASTIKAL